MGNSLLLRFIQKDNFQVITLDDDDNEPPSKRNRSENSTCETEPEKRLDSLNDCMASDVLDIKDVDELEVYGNVRQTSMQITSYVFEVRSKDILRKYFSYKVF